MLAGALFLGSLGCAQIAKRSDSSFTGPFHTAANVYISPDGLPANLQRVAVMPLVPGRGNRSAERGVPLIQQLFTEELSRARIFDVVTLTPDRLDTLIGVKALYADSRLPVEFISKIKEETGCQALLFAELTTFRAYPPVAVGWKLHLFQGFPKLQILQFPIQSPFLWHRLFCKFHLLFRELCAMHMRIAC